MNCKLLILLFLTLSLTSFSQEDSTIVLEKLDKSDFESTETVYKESKVYAASRIPEEIKSKISEIELNYSIQRVERGTYYMIVAVLTLSSWAIILHMIKQARRKQILNGIKFDASRLSSHIKLNY